MFADRGDERGYGGCRFLRFTSFILQETTYEMLVEDARVMLHKKAALFLENEAFSSNSVRVLVFAVLSRVP